MLSVENTLSRGSPGDRPPFPPYWGRGDLPSPRMAPTIGVLSRAIPLEVLGSIASHIVTGFYRFFGLSWETRVLSDDLVVGR